MPIGFGRSRGLLYCRARLTGSVGRKILPINRAKVGLEFEGSKTHARARVLESVREYLQYCKGSYCTVLRYHRKRAPSAFVRECSGRQQPAEPAPLAWVRSPDAFHTLSVRASSFQFYPPTVTYCSRYLSIHNITSQVTGE